MRLAIWTCFPILLLVACDDASPGVTDLGPDAPACTETEIVARKDACKRYRTVLCDRLVSDCDAYPTQQDCTDWFTNQYGDCEQASGEFPAAQASKMRECLCGLPNASCQALQEMGPEAALEPCAAW